MTLLDTLAADVQANTDAVAAFEQVVTTIVAELKALQGQDTVDPAALKALTDKLEANTASIVAATVANTPAAPTPAPAPAA